MFMQTLGWLAGWAGWLGWGLGSDPWGPYRHSDSCTYFNGGSFGFPDMKLWGECRDCHYKGSKVLQHAPLDAFVQDPVSHLVAAERGSLASETWRQRFFQLPRREIESYAFTAAKKLILAIVNNALWQHIFVGQLLGITDVTTSGCLSDATR